MVTTTQNGNNAFKPAKLELLPSFSPATLLSPGAIQTAIANQQLDFQEQIPGSWYLCGDVSKEMYGALAGQAHQDLALRVFGIKTPVGARYGIVCHQIQAHVHRFLLPLYEPRVGDFLLAMKAGRLGFQLGYSGSEEAAMLTTQVPVEAELVPLLGLASPLRREVARLAIGELSMVIAEISQPNRLPSLGSEPVSDVSVSVVLPTQTLQQCLAGDL